MTDLSGVGLFRICGLDYPPKLVMTASQIYSFVGLVKQMFSLISIISYFNKIWGDWKYRLLVANGSQEKCSSKEEETEEVSKVGG